MQTFSQDFHALTGTQLSALNKNIDTNDSTYSHLSQYYKHRYLTSETKQTLANVLTSRKSFQNKTLQTFSLI